MAGVLSNRTFLMKGTTTSGTTTYTQLVEILDFSDLGGAPESIDITPLNAIQRRTMNGIQDTESITFTCLYNEDNCTALDAVKNTAGQKFAIYFGGTDDSTPTGTLGRVNWEGELSYFINGASVNEAVKMTITISVSTAISIE